MLRVVSAPVLLCFFLCCGAQAEDGTVPDPQRVSYQQTFPGAAPGGWRMPSFMDVFASSSQKEYIKVGLKWSVAEMAYAVRLSAGHKPIALKTDDYHIEAFTKAKKAQASDFTKIRFRQKKTYSGTLGYAQPDSKKAGLFVLWDNKKKSYARLQLGSLQVMNTVSVAGNIVLKGKLLGRTAFTSKKNSAFAGTGFAFYTKPKGSKINHKKPRLFITSGGNFGV